jgi:hypothetical protein
MTHNDEHEDITVLMDYTGENEIRPFYCCKCGRFLCETTGATRDIIAGQPSSEERSKLGTSHIIKCFGVVYLGHGNREHCTAKYFFN